jgi:CRP-like cAMP-binding protein
MVKIKYPELYQHFDQWVHIPQEQWLEFEAKLSERTYAKGDFLIEAGDIKLELGFIMKGLFRLYYTDKNGKEQIKAFRKDHELVGAYAEMLLKIPSRTFVQAMESSKVILMKSEDFFPFYEKHSCWQTLGRIVAEKHFLVKEQREFEFLQLDVLQRYEIFRAEFGDVAGKIPQHQVASYLGITPVALSRVLSKVRKKQQL